MLAKLVERPQKAARLDKISFVTKLNYRGFPHLPYACLSDRDVSGVSEP